eukprot:5384888-Pyramimonas_sp.AAC.1
MHACLKREVLTHLTSFDGCLKLIACRSGSCGVLCTWSGPICRASVPTASVSNPVCSDDLVMMARACFNAAHRRARPFILGASDVAAFFYTMDHDILANALLKRSVHPVLVGCLIREVSGFCAKLNVPGAGATERFDLERGGKQGAVATPGEFNIFVE